MKDFLRKTVKKIKGQWKRMRVRVRRASSDFALSGGVRGAFARLVSELKRRSPKAIALLAGVLIVLAGGITAIATAGGGGTKAAAGDAEAASFLDLSAEYTPHPTTTPHPSATVEPTPTPVLFGKGTTGERVMVIQERLMELGYMDYDEPTEYYGTMTKEAVELFQKRTGLVVDGYVGEETYDALMRENAITYMVSVGDDGTDVEELQKRLVELDYMDKATGYFGDETEKAVIEFQKRNSLGVDGMIGTNTREALYSEDAVAKSLAYGESGDDVLKYQKRLYKLGYLTTEPDGTFGSDTLAAVKLFQELNGLIADGHIGPMTKELLMSSSAQANALTIGMSGSTVKSVQKKLKSLGYLSSADGYFGSGTESAVRSFQKNNGLTVDGKVGRITMSKLNSSSAVAASGNEPAATSGGGTVSTPAPGASNVSSTASVDAFLKAALSKLGSPYRTGGKGPSRFDCSGFVYWCLNQAGVRQGYMTSKSWRSVNKYQKISSIDNLKAGDVVVFRMSSSKGHVGIILNSSEMVDASSSEGSVVRRSYKTDYWRKYFYCAYRIF